MRRVAFYICLKYVWHHVTSRLTSRASFYELVRKLVTFHLANLLLYFR